jgi:hypothetical protein
LDLLGQWLSICQREHRSLGCPDIEDVVLPTRILYFGTTIDLQDVHLLTSEGQTGKYVALSYCWGGQNSLVATKATIEQMSRGIALASMPAMFRDAVIVAHRLGFSYLWIDSLCILQDCPDDWDRESGAMGEIYRRAAITIAAASAPNSHTGLLSVPPQASKELDPPCQLKLHANSDSRDTVSLTRVDWREEDLFFCLFDAPLAKRSWTLQERLLSHRTLYFGKRQIYWECQGGHHAADGEQDSPVIESFFVNFLSLTTLWATSNDIVAHSETRGDDIYNLWHSVLSLYCDNRELTFEKDKFPALSGLAYISINSPMILIWQGCGVTICTWGCYGRAGRKQGQQKRFAHLHGVGHPAKERSTLRVHFIDGWRHSMMQNS